MIKALIRFFGDDDARIEHALRVLFHAERLLSDRDDCDEEVVIAAALLHDVGIKISEEKHGYNNGKTQEQYGPAAAEKILADLDFPAKKIEKVKEIIGNHHSPSRYDYGELEVLKQADRIVNRSSCFFPRNMNIRDFQTGRLHDASAVMTAAAEDLRHRGIELWPPEQFTPERLAEDVKPDELITAYIAGQPVAAMILTFHDPIFWPDVAPDTSSFIHKLSVIPSHQGQGLAKQMIDHAIDLTLAKDIHVTRLDCDAGRPKLCSLYETLGYQKVEHRMVGPYPVAFYEKHI